ncbi:MAG: Choice-of-anchor protein [Bacteroidota bacterium]|nr:Choice-of-anchor protein [Bacteroidota bacterium]
MKKFNSFFSIIMLAAFLLPFLANAAESGYNPNVKLKNTVFKNGCLHLAQDLPPSKDGDNPLAEKPKYIIFNNFNPDYFNSAYWNYLKDPQINPEYYDKIVSEPFADATLNKYKMTDFDLAIFPMGDFPISVKTTSGQFYLIQVMKDMIAAGKKVLLIGNTIGSHAFNSISPYRDTVAQNFLKEYFGVNYIYAPNLVSTSSAGTTTWWSFNIRGHLADPVGMSVYKFVNISFNAGNEVWDPLRYPVLFLDCFKTLDEDLYPPVEHFILTNVDPVSDTIVGSRHERGLSRMVFIDIGFESFAGDIPRYTMMQRCMMWLLGNIPPDGPQIRFEPTSISYGNILIGQYFDNTLNIVSTGKANLRITETKWDNNDDNVYKITEGEVKASKPVILKTGEIHPVTIRFTPKENKEYTGWLTIESNAENSSGTPVILEGFGGEGSGAKVELNFADSKLDFGVVTPKTVKIDTVLMIKNAGDIELKIDIMKFTENESQLFSFPQVIQMPILIPPGKVAMVKLRFACGNQDGDYSATIHFETNAKDNPNFDFTLYGKVAENVSVKDNKAASSDGKLELTINPNPASNFALIGYKLNGSAPENIKVILIDNEGRKLLNIADKIFEPGEGTFQLNILPFASGSYYILAEIKGKAVRLPLIIVR